MTAWLLTLHIKWQNPSFISWLWALLYNGTRMNEVPISDILESRSFPRFRSRHFGQRRGFSPGNWLQSDDHKTIGILKVLPRFSGTYSAAQWSCQIPGQFRHSTYVYIFKQRGWSWAMLATRSRSWRTMPRGDNETKSEDGTWNETRRCYRKVNLHDAFSYLAEHSL
jgi:hypothetical protein